MLKWYLVMIYNSWIKECPCSGLNIQNGVKSIFKERWQERSLTTLPIRSALLTGRSRPSLSCSKLVCSWPNHFNFLPYFWITPIKHVVNDIGSEQWFFHLYWPDELTPISPTSSKFSNLMLSQSENNFCISTGIFSLDSIWKKSESKLNRLSWNWRNQEYEMLIGRRPQRFTHCESFQR